MRQGRSSRLRIVLWTATVAAALMAAGCDRPGPMAVAAESAPAAASAFAVTTVVLEPVELASIVAANGSIHPWQEIIISPEVGGYRVAEVHVDVGDRVRAGQELVRLSTALLETELATRAAALQQREAELANAESALRRAQSLSVREALAEADLDRLQSEQLGARARLEGARADLAMAELRREFARVRAPDDGIITERTVTVGQVAQAGGEMLRLLRHGRVEWRGEVPEALLGGLAPGQSASVTTADGKRIPGTVRVVGPTISSASRTGLVYVSLDSPHVRPGMFARGEVVTGLRHAFTVPLESLVSSDGYSYVFVVGADGRVTRRHIEIGAARDGLIEITSGVRAGERVVRRGAGFLKDGDLVEVIAAPGA